MATIPNVRQIFPKFFVSRPDGVTYQDLTDYLLSVEIERGDVSAVGTGNTGADGVAQTATFSLHNDGSQIITWLSTIARDSLAVIGDQTLLVGDELDGAEKLINLLFDTEHYFQRDSFSPIDKRSYWNYFNDAYAPLIFPMRKVFYRVAITSSPAQESGTTMRLNRTLGTGNGTQTVFQIPFFPILAGSVTIQTLTSGTWSTVSNYTVNYDTGQVIFTSAPANGLQIRYSCTFYKTRFSGYLGDDIKVNDTTVNLLCRDAAKLMQRAYIDVAKIYGSKTGVPAEDVIREIMDDNGLLGLPFTVPVSPHFNILEYELKYKSVWDAVQEIVANFGWFFGTRYDESVNDLVLTLIAPPRDKTTGDYTLTAEDDIYVGTLGFSDKDIRNKITITYFDKDLGKSVTLNPDDVAYAPYLKDQASIDTYGLFPMEIIEKDTSMIDTEAEALAFGYALLQDLKDLAGIYNLNLPVFPDMEMFDGINIDYPLISSTVDFYAVESIRESYNFSDDIQFRTEAIASGRVTGGRQKWLNMQTRPGAGAPISGTDLVDSKTVIYVAASDTPISKRNLATYICDGVADQEQINDAINSLNNNGEVILLEGSYVTDSVILMVDGVNLIGQGATTIKIIDGINVRTHMISHDYSTTTVSNIAIKNLTIDGNSSNSPATPGGATRLDGIYISGGANITVDNVTIKNFTGSGIMCVAGALGDTTENINIINTKISNCFIGALQSQSSLVTNFNITNCTISNNSMGVNLNKNGSISNSYIFSNSNTGIDARQNSVVTNCFVYLNGLYGIACVDFTGLVSGNTVYGNSQNVDNSTASIQVASGSNATIQGNKSRLGDQTNRPRYGINLLPGAVNTLVDSNDCFNSGVTAGIFDAGVGTNFGSGNRVNDGSWSTVPS